MRRALLLVAAGLLFFSVARVFAFQTGNDWISFVAPDNSFSALFPVQPEAPLHQKKTVEGSGDVVSDIWIARVGDSLYLAGITDYPVEINIQKELELDRDNFLKKVDATLIAESDISQNGFSGKEFTGVSADFTFKSRVFADHRRAYQVVVRELTASFSVSRADRFLKAFAITAKPR